LKYLFNFLTMSNKLNIFNSLPQYPSDDEEDQRGAKKTTQGGKTTTQTQKKVAAPVQKEEHSRAKETRKEKGVTAQPHPQDRHSGHGNQAYGGKPKKGGAGKGNWGKATEGEAATEERVAGEEEGTEAQPVVEEKPSLTLQEYYEQQRFAQEEQEVNEAKAKITSDQLLKELGKATALKSKNQEKNDDHRVGKKKGRLDVNHHAGLATEHGDLLGFRTGFIEKEYRQRGEGEEGKPEFRPRREGGDRREGGERRERREKEDAKQEETAQPTTTAEGEQAATTEQAGEGQERRREGGNRGGQRGGQRGDRGGNRGGQRGGNQGPRKPYTPKVDQAKINIADESAFPKLG
jgi:hypothetical protein